MKYISTRSMAPSVSARQATLGGLADGGGLYMPECWPTLSPAEITALRGYSFAAIAGRILAPFLLDEDLDDSALAHILNDCFGSGSGTLFDTPQIAPLVPVSDSDYLLELFHGPTLAFKDIALQFLARLINHYTRNSRGPLTFIGATSGDTGSAAIHACAQIPGAHTFILHPAKNVSEIQRRQMTTYPCSRVFNLAVDGTFDDCQAIVKSLLSDPKFVEQAGIVPVNSINWVRIILQASYYFSAALALPDSSPPPVFVVPTGNFGNILAGYVARQMGLPIERLVVASNHNDILYRFFKTGEMAIGRVTPSYSPSMDIQISSNFERFLFDLVGRDPRIVAHLMDTFKQQGNFRVTTNDHVRAGAIFSAYRVNNAQTLAAIKTFYEETKRVIDPHTAVGWHAAREHRRATRTPAPLIAMACAHPAKFPDTIKKAIGFSVPLPESIAHILTDIERVTPVRNDLNIVKNYISGIVGL